MAPIYFVFDSFISTIRFQIVFHYHAYFKFASICKFTISSSYENTFHVALQAPLCFYAFHKTIFVIFDFSLPLQALLSVLQAFSCVQQFTLSSTLIINPYSTLQPCDYVFLQTLSVFESHCANRVPVLNSFCRIVNNLLLKLVYHFRKSSYNV